MDFKHKKQLLNSIINHLQTVINDESLVKNKSEFENALKLLQSSTGLTADNSSSESFNLEKIFESHVKSLPEESPEFEEKFSKYVGLLEKRGYFANVSKGSQQYDELLQKARNRFIEKYGSTLKKTEDVKTSNEQKEDVKVENQKEEVQEKVEKLTIEVEEAKVEDVVEDVNNNDNDNDENSTTASNPFMSGNFPSFDPSTIQSFLDNPQVMQMTQQLMQSDDFQSFAQSMLNNPNFLNSFESMFRRQE